MAPVLTNKATGPSPRARGAVRASDSSGSSAGTIPACAGSSDPSHLISPWGGDHPRVRGEQDRILAHPGSERGPSPRARGAGQGGVAGDDVVGTIPACAGSSWTPSVVTESERDHPRVRGEQATRISVALMMLGPSPRARGADLHGRRGRQAHGTIPACAGSRPATSPSKRPLPDHPRVRGEQRAPAKTQVRTPGPSPRARGAAGVSSPSERGFGTIPACAGSRYGHSVTEPRHLGPSPRARGAGTRPPAGSSVPGTIPACAGSRGTTRPPRPGARDHPRVRGEQCTPGKPELMPTGPSPRARGAALAYLAGELDRRTIPACAGSRAERSASRT